MRNIKVILADDSDDTRSAIKSILDLDSTIDVVAEARNGKEVLEKIPSYEPEIIIMDYQMPIMDGIEATQQITRSYPKVSVIIMSVNDEIQNFRRAMMAGAKEYLTKPVASADLLASIHQVAELNRSDFGLRQSGPAPTAFTDNSTRKKIVSVFGTKGGVGKSVICTNLAYAAAQKSRNRVAIVDLDIQFGDVCILMNVEPRKTILELIQEGEESGKEMLEDFLYERHGVHILAPPVRPELAELVSPQAVARILNLFRNDYDYTFIDTPSYVDEVTLTGLEMSDTILLVVSLDLPSIQNSKKGIEILRSLGLMHRTKIVLNRSSGVAGIDPRDVARVLNVTIGAEIPSDGRLVFASMNQGIPYAKINPKAPVSKGIANTLQLLVNE